MLFCVWIALLQVNQDEKFNGKRNLSDGFGMSAVLFIALDCVTWDLGRKKLIVSATYYFEMTEEEAHLKPMSLLTSLRSRYLVFEFLPINHS